MQSRISINNRVSDTVLVVMFSLLFCSSTVLGQDEQLRELPPGQIITRILTGDEVHRYNVELKANEFFEMRVVHEGIDITLRLTDPRGTVLIEVPFASCLILACRKTQPLQCGHFMC
jgi:hypothetical protein